MMTKQKKSTYLVSYPHIIYFDIEKSLNMTVIEISSDSEIKVSYIKTTPSHPRDRLRQKLNNKETEGEVVVAVDNDDEDNDIDFVRVTPSHPRERL